MKSTSTTVTVLSLVIIIVAGLAVYLNSLGGEFLWDDLHFVVDNVYLRSWSYLPEIFGGDVAAGSGLRYNYYRPLATFTYLVDHSLWELNPAGYHLASVLFHLLVAVALFFLVHLLFGDGLLSFLTGLLYVVHPVHTETVAYVSGRPDSLCALFMLLCFILYVKYLRDGRPAHFALMAASFICAMLSRENSVVLPLLLLAYHLVFRVKLRPLPFLTITLASAAYLFLRWLLIPPAAAPPFVRRLPGFFASVSGYLGVLLWPFHLHQEYGEGSFRFFDGAVILGAAISAATLIICVRLAARGTAGEGGGEKRTSPGSIVLFSLLWFFAALLPFSGIYPIKAYMAEHWLYVPSVGLFLLAAYGLCRLYRSRCPKAVSLACITAVPVFYGSLTVSQNTYFSDPLTFYERTLRYSPWSARLRNNLAIQYFKAGRIDEAEAQFRKAVEIDPLYPEACNNLGHVYYTRGRNKEALSLYTKALEINPGYADAYCNLGVLCINTGTTEEGLEHFKKAAELNPLGADAFFNMGLACRMTGRDGEAAAAFERVLQLDPDYGAAHRQLALLYRAANRHAEAARHGDRARELGFPVDQGDGAARNEVQQIRRLDTMTRTDEKSPRSSERNPSNSDRKEERGL